MVSGKTKVLVIDDNTDLTQIIELILVSNGYEVDARHTLAEGSLQFYAWHPHILLLDVNIKGEDGRMFCTEIKSSTLGSKVQVVLMSGDESMLSTFTGPDDWLAKPFDAVVLLQKIEALSKQNTCYPVTCKQE